MALALLVQAGGESYDTAPVESEEDVLTHEGAANAENPLNGPAANTNFEVGTGLEDLAQLNQAESEAYNQAMNATRGDIYLSLSAAYEAMTDERRAAIVVNFLKQGVALEQALAERALTELNALVAASTGFGIVELANSAHSVDAIQNEVGRAVDQLDDGNLDLNLMIRRQTDNFRQLTDKLGIDGQGLLQHLNDNIRTVVPELVIILKTVMDDTPFNRASVVKGVSPKTIELLTPEHLMQNAGIAVLAAA